MGHYIGGGDWRVNGGRFCDSSADSSAPCDEQVFTLTQNRSAHWRCPTYCVCEKWRVRVARDTGRSAGSATTSELEDRICPTGSISAWLCSPKQIRNLTVKHLVLSLSSLDFNMCRDWIPGRTSYNTHFPWPARFQVARYVNSHNQWTGDLAATALNDMIGRTW